MTADELAELAAPLFGARWPLDLAERLGRSPATVKRWARGARALDLPTEIAVRCICKERAEEVEHLRQSDRRWLVIINGGPPPQRKPDPEGAREQLEAARKAVEEARGGVRSAKGVARLGDRIPGNGPAKAALRIAQARARLARAEAALRALEARGES